MRRLEIKNKELIQIKIQKYFEKSTESRFVHRLHGILLFIKSEDESCDSIGKLFGNSPRSISNWINKLNESGDLESLRDVKRLGRPPRLNSSQEAELKLILQQPPENSGMTSNIWDGKTLSAYIEMRYGIILQVRACQRLFHKLGFSLKRARPVVSKGDEKKKAESKKKLKEKQESDNYEIYYQDECHFKLTLSIIRAWFLKGICPEIKSAVDRFKVSVFGAMGVNGQLITYKNKTFNAETFKVFLEKLLLEAKVGCTKEGKRKKILLVLDNARYHHAKMLQPWLEEVSDLLELFFLPPYSPDLNAIEMLWKKTRRNVTHNRYFHSFDQLCFDLDAYWKIFCKPNEELKKLTAFI